MSGSLDPAKIGQAFRHCADLVRVQDKDRFLTSLFAPSDQRLFLCALYAFDIETARVRELVHEPMAGNIRLQWWHEAMAGLRPSEADAHPVLTALMYAVDAAAGGDRTLLTKVIEARQSELFGDPTAEAATAIFLMAVKLLGAEGDGSRVATDAGKTVTLLDDPARHDEAREAYAAFRADARDIPRKAKPAFLPLALIPLRLRNPDAPQWRRQLAILRAAWLGFPLI